MKKQTSNRMLTSIIAIALFAISATAQQTGLQMTKVMTRTMAGLENMMNTPGMTPAMQKQLAEMNTSTSTVYVKGSSMRTDTIRKVPKMTGTMETHTYSTVIQCDLERVTVFDTKRKRVSRYPMREPAALAEKATRSGAYITITGTVTDTGERMKLFGYEARRYKQNIQFTPSPNACQKQAFVMEIDGWYADLPGFSCPIKMAVPEDTDGSDCMDDIIYQVKGAVTGVALKEVKTFTMDGQKMMTVTEEVTEVKPASIEAAFFDPPADYKLAKP